MPIWFRVNKDKMDSAKDDIIEFLAEEYSISEEAAYEIVSLLYVDELRGDEFLAEEFIPLKELEEKGFGEFRESNT